MNDFHNLKLQEKKLRKVVEKFNLKERKSILGAFDLAKKAHEGQKRDDGAPYIIHPIRIANMLIDDLSIKSTDDIVAGLLHDVVEDTSITLAEIEKKFGRRAAKLVLALTRDKEKETKQEKFAKTLRAGKEIKLLKACDCLDNLRSYGRRTDRGDRWQRHLREAREINIPLAKATGNKWLIAEMEVAYDEVMQRL